MSKGLSDLAAFGGTPLFKMPRHANAPHFPGRSEFMKRVGSIFDSNWFTNDGPEVVELERQISSFLGVKHCVLTSNGTLGLQLLARALSLQGEVIVPSFTFIATAHAMEWEGVKPVFCDVRADSMAMDPEHCRRLISSETQAILAVHLWGSGCDVYELESIARKHGLFLLFDAAHAFGCSVDGRKIGSFGDAEVFSFHATKVFHTFEGGAVTTNSEELAASLRRMRNFGFTGLDRVESIGINAKMHEVSAAAGLANLAVFNHTVLKSKAVFDAYKSGLDDLGEVKMCDTAINGESNYHYVVCKVDPENCLLSRDTIVDLLVAENVLARRYFHPGCHRSAPYSAIHQDDLPITEMLSASIIVLPAGAAMEPEWATAICSKLRLIFECSEAIRSRLEK